jgi:uncharacterized protein
VLDDGTLAAQFRRATPVIQRQLQEGHARLLQARAARGRPATDDKVLAGWNGLMLRAFAQASRFLEDAGLSRMYVEVATRNAAFLRSQLYAGRRLRRTWRNGTVGSEVFLEDYGAVILGLLDLYQTSFDNRWFAAAQDLAQGMLDRFSDPDGGFFDSPSDADTLPLRPKDLQDNAVPSGNALACEALLRLAALGGDSRLSETARSSIQPVASSLGHYPTAFGHWLNAASLALAGEPQLAIIYAPSTDPSRLLEVANSTFHPNLVAAASAFPPPTEAPALLAGRRLIGGKPTAYVCHASTCRLPVNSPDDLTRELAIK